MVRAGLPLALGLGMLAAPAAAAALDDGRPGPGEAWQPGRILVRFVDGTSAAQSERIARAAEVGLVEHLPVVPNLWEVQTRGLVRDAMRRLGSQHDVEYVQPNYLDNSVNESGPADATYWPNDPYFWPAYFNNDDKCLDRSRVLGSWPLWRQGDDLTAVGAPGLQFDPLPLIKRFSTLRGNYPSHHSINVLPVWNLLGTQKRLTGPGPKGWTADDLRRYGIAVDDTGISDHPDLAGQVAALFTVVTSIEPGDSQPEDRIREVFRDNPGRNDVSAVTDALENQGDFTAQVQDAGRPLFMLDDPAVRNPEKWKPLDDRGRPQAPRGCDGHGTAVASVAAARANNDTGLIGVGYNVPVVGIRVGMPWDRPGVDYVTNDRIDKAIEAWEAWHKTADDTNADMILRAELVKALRLPVLNMSWGAPMAIDRPDKDGKVHPVLVQPALAEALARVLSTGTTLGVAAAGNDRQAYGRGPNGRGTIGQSGTEPDGMALPCGLKLLATLRAWTSKAVLVPGHIGPNAKADAPFHPNGVDWGRVELLCVGATSPDGEELMNRSGRGDRAVQVAAPGERITVANRPSVKHGVKAAYHVGDGTSFSAPMVAGAAALLRRAAPGAPIDAIRRALERGARRSSDLRGKVRYGELDVACALRALNADPTKEPKWDMVNIGEQTDPQAYRDFIQATSTCGERKPSRFEEDEFRITTANVFGPARTDPQTGRFATGQEWLDSANLEPGPASPSLDWQARLAGDRPWTSGERAVFPIRSGTLTPTTPPSRPVYTTTKNINIGCQEPGYQISGIKIGFTGLIHPSGWMFPTDAEPPSKKIQLAVALAKPWYLSLLPDVLRIRASVRCDFYPGLN